jgi:hypothetical protein
MPARNSADGAVVDAPESEKTENAVIAFSMPVEMKNLVEQAAKTANLATGHFVRRAVANAVGFEGQLGIGTRRSKYSGMSDEEKKALIGQKAKEKRDIMTRLYEEYLQKQAAGATTEPQA